MEQLKRSISPEALDEFRRRAQDEEARLMKRGLVKPNPYGNRRQRRAEAARERRQKVNA